MLTYRDYSNPKFINVINLNCLGELILGVKYNSDIRNNSLMVYHDRIDGYDKVFMEELNNLNINIEFLDWFENELIQISDNVVSIFGKCINQVINKFECELEWKSQNIWIMETFLKVINQLNVYNIKFDLPIQNWIISLVIKDMFKSNFLLDHRNNLYFNYLYRRYEEEIYINIIKQDFNHLAALNILKR